MTNWCCAGAIASLAVLFCATSPLAERYIWLAELDSESVRILEALRSETAKHTTEPFRESVEEQRYIDRITKDKVRQLALLRQEAIGGRSEPSVDLEVYFDYNSSAISPRAEPQLMTLGRALTNPELERNTFLIAAHTDARGTSDELQKLSERRAEAVKEFLKQRFRISDERLVAVGYGKELLKNPDDPFAEENRRIQIVNLSDEFRKCKRTPSAAPSCE